MVEDLIKEGKGLTYKGNPLVRCGDMIFYGDVAKDYIIRLEIITKNSDNGFYISENIVVSLLKSALVVHGNFKPIKTSKKNGLHEAIDLGLIWLDRALKNK